VERSVALPAQASSAREARVFLADLLVETAHPEWREAAELAVSEIVTNAVLHAHTALTVTVLLEADRMRVDVRDNSPALPALRQYDESATTGRGMALIAAVTTSHGVTPLPSGGKVVWFTLGGDVPEADADSLLEAWDDEPAAPAVGSTEVALPGMPPTLWMAARQHHDSLIRELTLLQGSDVQAASRLALADEARRSISEATERAVARATAQGLARDPLPATHPSPLPEVPPAVDVMLSVAANGQRAFVALQEVLDEAEALARADRLLMRPGLPEVIAVRDWACDQVTAQLAGEPPTPWAGADAERFTYETNDAGRPGLGWDVAQVRDAARGAVAADDANRIVAISRPLADALGWDQDQLVGRRVVALVPPRFREAHVAGFTHHLATGEARVLGVDLELPVLRADGSEVVCSFLIESTATPTGRTVYTAWITPLS